VAGLRSGTPGYIKRTIYESSTIEAIRTKTRQVIPDFLSRQRERYTNHHMSLQYKLTRLIGRPNIHASQEISRTLRYILADALSAILFRNVPQNKLVLPQRTEIFISFSVRMLMSSSIFFWCCTLNSFLTRPICHTKQHRHAQWTAVELVNTSFNRGENVWGG